MIVQISSTTSLLNTLVRRLRLPWWVFITAVALILLILLMGALYLDGLWGVFFRGGYWRLLVQPVIIIYILFIFPFMTRMQDKVFEALRPVVLVDDQEFKRLIEGAKQGKANRELSAFGMAALLGILLSGPGLLMNRFAWLNWYGVLTGCLMLGLLGMVIYGSFSDTKLMAELQRQPLNVDLFDPKPFEPIGRQSIMIVLAFIGGSTLSMFFLISPESLLTIENLVINGILISIGFLIFFLNMRHTHGVLAAAKNQELEKVVNNLAAVYQKLNKFAAENKDTRVISAEVTAWIACEQRLKETRTWPYNTGMLRTLFFSVLIPALAALARIVAELFFK